MLLSASQEPLASHTGSTQVVATHPYRYGSLLSSRVRLKTKCQGAFLVAAIKLLLASVTPSLAGSSHTEVIPYVN